MVTKQSRPTHSTSVTRIALMVAFGALGIVVALTATSPYPGATVDSGEYLAVADGVLEGKGFTMPYVNYDEPFRVLSPGERIPMTQFPPLYPAALAGERAVTGAGILSSARWLGVGAYALLIAVAMAIVMKETHSTRAGLIAGGLLLSTNFVTAYSTAWSEQLMLLGLLGALYFSAGYVRIHRMSVLAVACGCASLASLSRLAGIAAIAALGCIVLLDRSRPFLRRLVTAGVASGTAAVPLMAWLARNVAVAGHASEKQLHWHPPSRRHLTQAAETLGGWVVPGRAIGIAAGVLVAAAFVILVVRWTRSRDRLLDGTARACLVFGLAYTAFVVLSRTLIDQNIPLDARILLPLQLLVVLGLCAWWGSSSSGAKRAVSPFLVALAIAGVVGGAVTAVTFTESTRAAYASEDWQRSDTLAYAGDLPSTTLIITNAPDAIWIWHDRPSQILPPRANLYNGEPNADFSKQVRALHEVARCREAVLVFFDQPTRRPPRTVDPFVAQVFDLRKIERFADGTVYDVTEPAFECP